MLSPQGRFLQTRDYNIVKTVGTRYQLIYAGVVELVDSMDLGSIALMVCGFESRRPHHVGASFISLAPTFCPTKNRQHPFDAACLQIIHVAGHGTQCELIPELR